MLVLLLVSAVATIVGVRGLVDQVRATARQLHVESVTVATLTSDVVAHEEVGHKILSMSPLTALGMFNSSKKSLRFLTMPRLCSPSTTARGQP